MAAARYSITEHILFPPARLNESKLKNRLNGKTVLITGASFGIGECLAYKLAGTGARLILVARTEEKLQQVKEEIERRGGKARVFATDLSKPEQVEVLVSDLVQLPDGIDYLVSNAGKSIRRSVKDSLDRYHDFKRSMAINYFGPVNLILSLLPIIEKKEGQIINVSSVSVLLAPAPYWAAYQSSKSAFDNWFRCVSPELNAAGVYTTSVYLPLVKTRMIAPTIAYNTMPAMSAEHASLVICKAINSKRRKMAPWWLIAGQLASVVFRGPWEYFSAKYLKNK